MATPMLNFFSACVYTDSYSLTWDNLNGTWQFPALFKSPSYQFFPKNGVKITTVSPAVTVTNQGVSVTINSIIEILPTGPNQKYERFATDSTTVQLYNNGA